MATTADERDATTEPVISESPTDVYRKKYPDPRDVIIKPVVSEKSYSELNRNWYTFLVHPDANKTEIKIAIQQIFEVRVLSVNTINRQGKRKRTRTGWGKRKDTKRAMVKLADGDRIEAFGGPVS